MCKCFISISKISDIFGIFENITIFSNPGCFMTMVYVFSKRERAVIDKISTLVPPDVKDLPDAFYIPVKRPQVTRYQQQDSYQ